MDMTTEVFNQATSGYFEVVTRMARFACRVPARYCDRQRALAYRAYLHTTRALWSMVLMLLLPDSVVIVSESR